MNNYVPTAWVNDSIPALDAENLNHIEAGVRAVTDAVLALHAAGISPDAIAATILSAAKLPAGADNRLLVSAANNIRRSDYSVTNSDGDINGGATNKVPTASLVYRVKQALLQAMLSQSNIYSILDNTLQGDSYVSPSLHVVSQTGGACQLVYDDSGDNRHVLLSLPDFNEMEYASRKVDRISSVNNAQPADSVNYPSVNAVKALLGDGYFTRTESNPTVTAGFAGSGVPIFVSGNTMFSAGACTGNIVTLFVPRTVTKIDGGAFSNCASLTDVYIDNEAKSDDNPNGIEITSSAFGNSVTVHYNAKFNAVTQLIMAIHAGVS